MAVRFRSAWSAATVVVAALACASSFSSAKAANELDDAVRSAKYLTEGELFQLYANRSWLWESGAGYYRSKERRFTAYSNGPEGAQYAEGIWYLTDQGRLCMRSVWYNTKGAFKTQSCFEHRTDGKTIYQRSLPDGEWWILGKGFSSIKKLVPGDRVSDRLMRNQAILND